MSDYAAGGVEQVAALYRRDGFDGFGVLVDAVVSSGRAAFATLRMNDVAHGRAGKWPRTVHRCALPGASGVAASGGWTELRRAGGARAPAGDDGGAAPALSIHRTRNGFSAGAAVFPAQPDAGGGGISGARRRRGQVRGAVD